ncbi:MAG: isocitrate/isopropylmalate dehydrogenase family protein [Thermoproteota archaeon]
MTKKVAVIRGDGTGPELTEAAMKVMKAIGATEKIEFLIRDAGSEWWQKHGGPSYFPEETWEVLRESNACYKAPVTTLPDPNTPKSVAVTIRQTFDLYANVRPIRTFKGREGPLGSVDMLFVREATEGLYFGAEFMLSDDIGIAIRKISRKASEKVARFAFNQAKARGWKKVIVINKANILKLTDGGIFVPTVMKIGSEYQGINVENYFVDNFAQQLIKNPQRFNQNVIVGTNLFMDILTEEASALIGNIGLVYSANFGDNYAMFEPAHGSAPKYKGLNKVNPTAMILAGAWMLDYLGEKDLFKVVFDATEETIAEGKVVTYDLGGSASTQQMAEEIARKAVEKLRK